MQFLGRWFTSVIIAGVVTLSIFSGSAAAQEHSWSADIGGGYTPLVGAIGNRLDNGWHVTFGAGKNFTDHFYLGARFLYSGLGVNPDVLTEADVPGADAHVLA